MFKGLRYRVVSGATLGCRTARVRVSVPDSTLYLYGEFPGDLPHQVFAIRTTAIKGNRTALGLDEDGFEGSFRKVSPQLLGSRMENPIDILDLAAPGRIGGRSDVQRMVGCMDYRTRHGETPPQSSSKCMS